MDDTFIRVASATKTARCRTPARLYVYDTILHRLMQDFKGMAPALRLFIQEEHAVGPRDPSLGLGRCPLPIRPTADIV
jgi:hypothetical protein